MVPLQSNVESHYSDEFHFRPKSQSSIDPLQFSFTGLPRLGNSMPFFPSQGYPIRGIWCLFTSHCYPIRGSPCLFSFTGLPRLRKSAVFHHRANPLGEVCAFFLYRATPFASLPSSEQGTLEIHIHWSS